MKIQIYNALVNRHTGICNRYHKYCSRFGKKHKLRSYGYLIYLNISYYVFQCKYLDVPEDAQVYEEKKLLYSCSESEYANNARYKLEEYMKRIAAYDIISFDIFDTLIFRPFSEPTDIFYFVGAQLGILDFKNIRIIQEYEARQEQFHSAHHYEINFSDIWNRIEKEVGIEKTYGMMIEKKIEEKFCYANPFMLELFCSLKKMGKKIIIISDMYFSKSFLKKILEKNGYTGITDIYVSSEYGISKANGKLFELIKKEFKNSTSMVHIGDNKVSDINMAQKYGFDSLYYPNINQMAAAFRTYDMSPIIGGAYRAIVNQYLYQGLYTYSMEYEYGFIYGGLFVLGYCQFIHKYCTSHKIDKILFLSRDGDILKQVYDQIYPNENTSYVYWSRAAATKLLAQYNHYDYFRRYLYHKINQKISIQKILCSMELQGLIESLNVYIDKDSSGKKTNIILNLEDELTDKNVEALKRFLQLYFNEIIQQYKVQNKAARLYYTKELIHCKRAAAVDIGWAGSGAISLAFLVERIWNLPCEIVGIIAGTNTIHNKESDASEIFLQSGKLVSYLFSQSDNREVMKKHNPNKNYNVYWELLLSSPTKQFLGFDLDNQKVIFHFGKEETNQKGIKEIQKGILDFIKEYRKHFNDFPFMLDISGRDAYAAMLLAASHGEKYLKSIAKKISLDIGVS